MAVKFSHVQPQVVQESYRRSQETVRLAHARAEEAAARARQTREAIRRRRTAHPPAAVAQLAAAEAARAARENERFIAVVSHELRQPLNAALAAFSMLEANAGADTSAKASRVIGRQLVQMSRLLDDLLDMSRLSVDQLRLRRAPFDLRSAVEAALETVGRRAEERKQTVRVELPVDRVEVDGDTSRLEQVFANLLSNAVRYTPRGGEIRLTVAVEADRAVVRVTDTGQGIEAGDLPRVFDPFVRGASGSVDGLGIGLTLVRGIVHLHGGVVRAASDGPGLGATFTVELPVVRSTMTDP